MSIVTISRGSYSRGREVAERLAEQLGYKCVSREIILEACAEFNIPEIKMERALHDAPSVLERFQHGKERFLGYYRYAMLKYMQQDNIVYHGLAGHFLLAELPHVLKVRINAPIQDRVREEMNREQIPEEKARYILKKDDDERRRWALTVHGIDTWDSRLYDMVLQIDTLTVADAVQILYETVQKPIFRTSPEAVQLLAEMTRAARIQAKLVDVAPRVKVDMVGATVFLSNIGGEQRGGSELRRKLEAATLALEGVESVVFREPLQERSDYINPYHNI